MKILIHTTAENQANSHVSIPTKQKHMHRRDDGHAFARHAGQCYPIKTVEIKRDKLMLY
jgi:hypothetical protein